MVGWRAAEHREGSVLRLTTRRYLPIAFLVALALSAASAPLASAASGTPVISDCEQHLRLTQTYSIGQLQNALATMPADIQQYSNCQDVIKRALLVATERSKAAVVGGGSGGGSALPTPVIIVLVVLALAAITLGAVAIRRRRR